MLPTSDRGLVNVFNTLQATPEVQADISGLKSVCAI